MFSEGFRQVPRKLIRLINENPNAVLMYCYLIDHMDDRAEMTYRMLVSKECNGIGMTRKMARDALSDLEALGAITASRSGNGVCVSAVNYCNCSGPREGHVRATKRATSRATLNKTDIVDIFGNIDDDIIGEGHEKGHEKGHHFDQSRATLGGVLDRGDKREKNTIADDMLTPVSLAPQQAESPTQKKRKQAKPKLPSKSGTLYKSYSEEFLAAYGLAPLKWNAAENTSAGKLIDEVGEEISIEMVKRYFKINDKYVKSAKHPFLHLYKFRQQYYVTTKEVPKKIEYTTFVNKEKKCCIDLAAKIRETINNERKELP